MSYNYYYLACFMIKLYHYVAGSRKLGMLGNLEINVRYPTVRGKIFLFLTVGLIVFGLFNMATQSYAATHEGINLPDSLKSEDLINYAIAQGLSQIGPFLAGALPLGFSFLRKQGIKIDKDAEAYFIKTIPKLVENQSRWIYEQMKDENTLKQYQEEDKKSGLPKKSFPNSLAKAALTNVTNDLTSMLNSEGFRDSTKKILTDNMKNAIESAVTQNNKVLTDRSRNLIKDLTPLIIDSLLLDYNSKDDAKAAKKKIINAAATSIKENFDFEEIMFDEKLAEIFVKSELNKKIGVVT